MIAHWEEEAIETLRFDAMTDAKDLVRHMERTCRGSGYRFSLPGNLPASRSAVDQLRLYAIGRTPQDAAGPPKGPRGLYLASQLKILDRSKVVTFCDGLVTLSAHQAPDLIFARENPEKRGEGGALDCGMRRLSDGRFLYLGKDCPKEAERLFMRAVEFLKRRGWSWGKDLWGWDANHLEKP